MKATAFAHWLIPKMLFFCGLLILADAGDGGSLPRIRVAQDGRGFVDAAGKPFVPFGVTYYRPGTGWAPQVWKQWDAEATRKDLRRLKDLGGNCVRVFTTFGSFYPEPGRLNEDAVAKLESLLNLAEEVGVYVHPTGPDHWEGIPAWVRGDMFAEEKLLQAREEFWRMLAGRFRGRTAIFAYDLLNEPEVGWDSPAMKIRWNGWLQKKYATTDRLAERWGPQAPTRQWGSIPIPIAAKAVKTRELDDYQDFREDLADQWARRQVAAIKAADAEAMATIGYIQWSVPALLPGLQHYSAFRPSRQAAFLDFLEIHFYPLASGFYEYGSAEAEGRNLAYLESVLREVARPGKPVVVAEFGWQGGGQLTIDNGKHPPATEADQARWCRQVVETTRAMADGWLNWGFFDHPQAGDVSQLTGLLTVDGKSKAWGLAFQELAQKNQTAQSQRRLPAGRPELDWDACRRDPQAAAVFRASYWEAWQKDQKP